MAYIVVFLNVYSHKIYLRKIFLLFLYAPISYVCIWSDGFTFTSQMIRAYEEAYKKIQTIISWISLEAK